MVTINAQQLSTGWAVTVSCLSGDDKPNLFHPPGVFSAGLVPMPNGALLRELDTGKTYRLDADSAAWFPQPAAQDYSPIVNNAGAHNGIYRGKYLGSTVTAEQYAAINSGTFDDLFIGDYWTINNVNWRIAAFDYWLHCGDTECTTHHVVIVPDTGLYNAQMNTSNVVTGAYVGSEMYTTNLAQAKTTINDAFGVAHILNHREYLKNAVNDAYESAGAWYNSTVELMTEQMVYGGKIFANSLQAGHFATQYTIGKSQLPLFALESRQICNRVSWWLRDVTSSTSFAFVRSSGIANSDQSSHTFGVRPAFGICT